MESIPVGEFKSRFREVLAAVRAGQTVIVSFGRKHVQVAALVPIGHVLAPRPRALGVLEGEASVEFAADSSISGEELLGVH